MLLFSIFMIIMNFILPITFLIFGIIYSNCPPKKISRYSGYRSSMSMKNNKTWAFAHKAFGRILLGLGVFFLLCALATTLLVVFDCRMAMILTISTIEVFVQIGSCIISCVLVEKSLKREFDENGIHR